MEKYQNINYFLIEGISDSIPFVFAQRRENTNAVASKPAATGFSVAIPTQASKVVHAAPFTTLHDFFKNNSAYLLKLSGKSFDAQSVFLTACSVIYVLN